MIHTVPPNYPGVGRKVYPGFLQHAGFVAMNPERHVDVALGLLPETCCAATTTTPKRIAASTTNTTPCSTWPPSITSTPSAIVFQELRAAEGTWDVRRRARASAGHQAHRALHDRRRARRHLRHRPDRGRARSVHRHRRRAQAALDRERRGHYGIFCGRRWREVVYPQLRDFIREHA